MKTNVEPFVILFREIDDGIRIAIGNDLPISSIELDEKEWDVFIDAFLHYRVARSLLGNASEPGGPITHSTGDILLANKAGAIYYRGIKIYREKT